MFLPYIIDVFHHIDIKFLLSSMQQMVESNKTYEHDYA